SGYEPEGREFESLRAHHSFDHLQAGFAETWFGAAPDISKELSALLRSPSKQDRWFIAFVEKGSEVNQ
ncbi:MAG: hypothetical protein ACRD23_13655, partial [Terriglobales bacterium]